MRKVKCWMEQAAQRSLDASTLEVFKVRMNGALGNLIYKKALLLVFKELSNPNHSKIL